MNAHAQLRQLSIGTPSGNWGEMTCSNLKTGGERPVRMLVFGSTGECVRINRLRGATSQRGAESNRRGNKFRTEPVQLKDCVVRDS